MKWLNCEEMRVLLVVFVFAVVLGGTANADFTFGEPTPLGPTVNAGGNGAYFPSISADGLTLYFCSNRPGGISDRADIWMSSRNTIQEDWGEPVNLGPKINSYNIDWDPSISSDGLELYFASQRPDGSYPGFDIFVTERQTVDDDWGQPVDLGTIINSPVNEGGPCISADGLELYFTSDLPVGGKMNIYVARRTAKDEPWQEPILLNENVNGLPRSLWSPNISADGLVLFFDYGDGIWMTRRETSSDPWQEAVDIGPMINTWYAEAAAVSHDGSMLYFSSDRPGGTADWNIWQAPIVPIVDFNSDGIVDIDDLVIMIENWGTDNSLCDIGPMPWGDGVVDDADLEVLMSYWGQEFKFLPLDLLVDLLAYWRLDEAEGTIAYDSSAGQNDADVFGDVIWQPEGGMVDGALELDGIDDCISTQFIINPAKIFSVFAWIKGGAPGQVIVSQEIGANWLMLDQNTGCLMTELKASASRGGHALTSQVVIADDLWHLIGFVWDGTNRILYVDDTEVASDTQDGIFGSNGGLYIGAGKGLESGTFWSGLIDDVRIYDRAITP